MDDQPVLRYAVRQLLQDYAGVRAVTEAGTEREALRQREQNHPDMVITELSISGEHWTYVEPESAHGVPFVCRRDGVEDKADTCCAHRP
ncbi:MAG TPA: hypothetical protein VG674_09610 [Amycolatopsis sp.]|uniref:Response regulatory domain-containing protein n=1 Tax=Amycolatopsis nalaikhensis TaxID=715472 RepID=A0ABY8XE01_9PSEU|nr:hypothetical protein [Amycolatopsis sp. 2-2]WIV53831.1 hypothetical protein QP939_33790 [Amycolatopsis sp. 2-2]HWD02695.1 hypothetical protein [Amycolatopsis sp.]